MKLNEFCPSCQQTTASRIVSHPSGTEYIAFKVPAIPVAQPRQRHRIVSSGGRQFATNYTPKADPVNAYKAAVQIAFRNAYDGAPCDGPVGVRMTFLMPRPKRLIWKKKPMPREPYLKQPDIDNLEKSTLDALQGLLFRNDSQVYRLVGVKQYAGGDEAPHVEIEVVI